MTTAGFDLPAIPSAPAIEGAGRFPVPVPEDVQYVATVYRGQPLFGGEIVALTDAEGGIYVATSRPIGLFGLGGDDEARDPNRHFTDPWTGDVLVRPAIGDGTRAVVVWSARAPTSALRAAAEAFTIADGSLAVAAPFHEIGRLSSSWPDAATTIERRESRDSVHVVAVSPEEQVALWALMRSEGLDEERTNTGSYVEAKFPPFESDDGRWTGTFSEAFVGTVVPGTPGLAYLDEPNFRNAGSGPLELVDEDDARLIADPGDFGDVVRVHLDRARRRTGGTVSAESDVHGLRRWFVTNADVIERLITRVGPTTCALDALPAPDDLRTYITCTEADGPLVASTTGPGLHMGRPGEYFDVWGRAVPEIVRIEAVLVDGSRRDAAVVDGFFTAEIGAVLPVDAVIGYAAGGAVVATVEADADGALPGWIVWDWATRR